MVGVLSQLTEHLFRDGCLFPRSVSSPIIPEHQNAFIIFVNL